MLLLWIAIGVIVYYVFIKDSKSSFGSHAEDILKQRYVNGEIDESTYNRMKETLRK
jgi:putative membrane protein